MSDAEKVCHNWKDHLTEGQPKVCLREVDEQYTMDFTDVAPGAYIYWCASCGPLETAIGEAFAKFVAHSPKNAARAHAEIEKAVAERRS